MRILAPDREDDDEGSFFPLCRYPFGQGTHGGDLAVAGGVFHADQRLQPGHDVGFDEFLVSREIEPFDDARKHVARGQDPQLAFDLEKLGIALRTGREDVVADDV